MWRLDRGEETDCSQAVCQYLMHEVLQLIQLWNKNKLRVKSTYGRTKNVVHFKFKIFPNIVITLLRQLSHNCGRLKKGSIGPLCQVKKNPINNLD